MQVQNVKTLPEISCLSLKERIHYRARLLHWYNQAGRTLPWRIRSETHAGSKGRDAYGIWLSEIMLQQTTIAHATPYWHKFLKRWPTVHALANAPREQVLACWAGLGYYARARNLHKCAILVSKAYDGVFPSSVDELLKLPGVGEYTANAICAAAFDRPASVVDGNVERVMSRFFAIKTPLPKSKPEIKAVAANLADPENSRDYSQAIMDLGSLVCTPKAPHCSLCPWQTGCMAYRDDEPLQYPVKLPRKAKPKRYGVCYHVTKNTQIWLRRRDDNGLLGGMMEIPGSDWRETKGVSFTAPFKTQWRKAGTVIHVFTHFSLNLEVWCAQVSEDWTINDGELVLIENLNDVGLPSVMMKAAKLGLSGQFEDG